MEGDSVVCPLEDNLKLELDGVLLLVDVDELHQHDGDADRDCHDGVVRLADRGDRGHPPLIYY